MDKTLKWAVVGGIAVASCSVAYYFFWFTPNKEAVAQERYHQEQVADCLKKVDDDFKPISQNLVNGLLTAKSESDKETIRVGIESLTSRWDSEKANCQNAK